MKIEPCEFCDEFRSGHFGLYGIEKRILFQDDNFVVFPGLGQLVEGYCLIAPREHYLSMGALPETLHASLEVVLLKVSVALATHYTAPLVFEHGSASCTHRGASCIDHAHFHCMPVQVDIIADLEARFPCRLIHSLSDLKDQYTAGKPYFFVQDQKGVRYIFEVPNTVPSQYIRRLIAEKLGKPDKWDWGVFHGSEGMQRSITKLKNLF
mgnify:CR=1 FL=1